MSKDEFFPIIFVLKINNVIWKMINVNVILFSFKKINNIIWKKVKMIFFILWLYSIKFVNMIQEENI